MCPRIVSSLLTLCLTLAMIAGAAMAGVAQGHAMAAPGDGLVMVICDADGGTKTITVDALGNPIAPERQCTKQYCANCPVTLAVDLPALAAVTSPACTAQPAFAAEVHLSCPSHSGLFPPARGPPVKV